LTGMTLDERGAMHELASKFGTSIELAHGHK
jgi:hypothetical protein